MILFVGLGNPTSQYQNTRHNIGFMAIDEMIKSYETTSINKPKFKGELYKYSSYLFLKPTTYMNLSGESVRAVNEFYKPDRIIVIHDDLDLDLGSVRFKIGGSSGGHNGIKSIDANIGNEYERVRLGIGKPQTKAQVIKYVLQDFKQDETPCLHKVINHCVKALKASMSEPLESVRDEFTCKKGLCDG